MTVGELKKELKGIKDSVKVYICNDWTACTDDGVLVDLSELVCVSKQHVVIDWGMDFEDLDEVILEFKKESD